MAGSVEQLRKAAAAAQTQLQKLTDTQRQWATLVLLLVLLLAALLLISPIQSAFHKQSAQIAAAVRDIRALPAVFQQYTELANQKAMLEKSYQDVHIREDEVVATIESLIKNTAGIKEGFSVREPAVRDLGGYKKLSVTVSNLRVTNFPKFVEFLDQVVSGEKPFLLERIDINRSSMGDFFLVTLDISSIQRSTPN